MAGIQRDSADHVAERGSEEDRQKSARKREEPVEEIPPEPALQVMPELDAERAQDEQPEHNHERQVEAAETRGVKEREGVEESAPGRDQPDFVAVPDGADGAEERAPLVLRTGG